MAGGVWAAIAAVCGGLVLLAAGVAAVLYLTTLLRRMAVTWADFHEDWAGQPERAGVPERPGVMVRLARIEGRLGAVEAELSPDGGRSIKDQVTEIARVTGAGGP